jgi:hypothetical protein
LSIAMQHRFNVLRPVISGGLVRTPQSAGSADPTRSVAQLDDPSRRKVPQVLPPHRENHGHCGKDRGARAAGWGRSPLAPQRVPGDFVIQILRADNVIAITAFAD